MVSYLLKGAACSDPTLFKQKDAVSVLEVAERVSHQKPGAASEVLPHRIEERRADMSVHAAQHVVEQIADQQRHQAGGGAVAHVEQQRQAEGGPEVGAVVGEKTAIGGEVQGRRGNPGSRRSTGGKQVEQLAGDPLGSPRPAPPPATAGGGSRCPPSRRTGRRAPRPRLHPRAAPRVSSRFIGRGATTTKTKQF